MLGSMGSIQGGTKMREAKGLLVQIEDDLRMPDVVELGDGEARFSLREEITSRG